MTAWRGFIPESKSYMGYDKRTFRKKLTFWLQVPGAAIRFFGMSGSTMTALKNLFLWPVERLRLR